MSATDKIKNKTEELSGKAKEKAGQATGNPEREQKGKDDQAKAHLKGAGEKVKDVLED